MSDFAELVDAVRAFSAERDWEQFHTPKNLAMAVAGEAGELAAELQWVDGERSRSLVRSDSALHDRVAFEMADVLIYLARLADVAGVDLLAVAHEKLRLNAERFPPGASPSRA